MMFIILSGIIGLMILFFFFVVMLSITLVSLIKEYIQKGNYKKKRKGKKENEQSINKKC